MASTLERSRSSAYRREARRAAAGSSKAPISAPSAQERLFTMRGDWSLASAIAKLRAAP